LLRFATITRSKPEAGRQVTDMSPTPVDKQLAEVLG